MNINLYDNQLNRIAIIGEQYVSCLWREGYNSMGSFTLELPAVEKYKKSVRENCYIGRNDRKSLMVVKTVEIYSDKIIATGKPAIRVLDDIAYIGKIGNTDSFPDAIKSAYDSSRKIENVEFAESNLIVPYSPTISNKTFLGLCEEICQSEDVGFRCVKQDTVALIEFYRPQANPNLVYSQQFGNLDFKKLTISTETLKNYAIVLGQGEGEGRVRVDVDESNGGAVFEMIVDARDVQREEDETEAEYYSRLEARGREKLLETRGVYKCEFSPIAKDFGVRYDLGDILTIYLPDLGLKLSARVASFSQKSQGNKTTTTIEVGTITIMR